ncbi:hypothetical protein B0T24DRAFT_506168, partial [Lasiosphaeria ovina]
GSRYMLDDWIYKKRKRRSWIGAYGTFVVLLSRHGERLEGSFWICALCSGGMLFNAKATSSTSIHL